MRWYDWLLTVLLAGIGFGVLIGVAVVCVRWAIGPWD